jgi:hypothetical protein
MNTIWKERKKKRRDASENIILLFVENLELRCIKNDINP